MEKTSNFTFRINSKLKSDAEKLYSELGINLTSAINLFLHQSVRDKEMPFKPSMREAAHDLSSHIPNYQTLAALQEVEDIKKGKIPKQSLTAEELIKELEMDE